MHPSHLSEESIGHSVYAHIHIHINICLAIWTGKIATGEQGK